MEESWTNRPTKINMWNSNIDYVMFVDENGNSDIRDILKCISKNQEIDINNNFFTVTGAIFTKENYLDAKNKLNELKLKYWKNGFATMNAWDTVKGLLAFKGNSQKRRCF